MNLEPGWVSGFVDGEGCFHVGINSHPEMSSGFQVLPEFTVVQHERDVQVLHALKAYFGCGVVRRNHGDRMAYRVRGKEHLLQHIIPFFEKHPLKNVITKAVGAKDTIDIEVVEHPLASGDVLMLCSDGLHAMINDDEIRRLLSPVPESLDEAAAKLIAAANEAGGKDNVTVVLLRYTE